MDKRLREINLRLSEYSLGNFNNRINVSTQLDEVDAISSSINMLGEELKAITISRNYFTNIFNSVSDMVFILNTKGIITDVNNSAEEQLKYEPGSLIGKTISDLNKGNLSYFRNIIKELKDNIPFTDNETFLNTSKGETIPVRINVSHFNDEIKNQFILLTATDIAFQIKAENRIIRAIIDTQEKERQRLSKDFHDSLIQQLSGIQFYISSTSYLSKSEKLKAILIKSSEALSEAITEMRNICFNLMPNTLEEFGLVKAVQEFCSHFFHNKKTKFIIEQNCSLPDFSSEIKIDLYRVIQEFINNSLKHGDATKITISFNYHKKILEVILSDNGKGFDSKQCRKGMGLQNVKSRVKSHNGTLKIISSIGKGTGYTITIPLNI
jgi:PAS domain S-box-containing protein